MKKLGIIVSTLGRGGAERITVYLASYFKTHGWNCDIITLSKGKNEYALPTGVKRYIACDCQSGIFKKIINLRKKIKESSPNAILIMDTPLCTYAFLAVCGLKIPFFVSERNDPEHFAGNKLNIKIARCFMKKAVGYIFQTNGAKNFYSKILHERGTVIPNPLVNEQLPDIYCEERKKRIVTVGRLHMQKNHKMLIKAFAEIHKIYPEYFLDIYGEGVLELDLKILCRKLNISDFVIFHGNIINVAEKIKNAAMFVMTSDFEGMPNALIEAMAVGLPCISTDCPCGGPRELIENTENGLLINTNDVKGLKDAIILFIENNWLAEHCGKNALNIRKKLDSNIIGKKWLEYIEMTLCSVH